jgi:hypothetical protein
MKIASILEKEYEAQWRELAALQAAGEADESLWLLDFLSVGEVFAQLGVPSEGSAGS